MHPLPSETKKHQENMKPIELNRTKPSRHIVAMPYPGRGHINPMLSMCKLLASKHQNILITFVLTQEWLGLIGTSIEPKPHNMRFVTIPNCVPSEHVRAQDIRAFLEAVMTKMTAPFELLLDGLELQPSVIMHDTYLYWVVEVGTRRSIPTASFYTMSATVFSFLQRFHLLKQNNHFPVNVSEIGDDRVEYMPGMSPTRLLDLAFFVDKDAQDIISAIRGSFSLLPNSHYVLLPTVYELESRVIDALKKDFAYPIYIVGPTISYLKLEDSSVEDGSEYFQWLDNQPSGSVLYVSLGSFLSVSLEQMDEIAAGLQESGVRFLWVARTEASRLKYICGDRGFVVTWCDQLRVLDHSSVGGFWSHCGWSSTMEGVFSGLPFLTFPLVADQAINSKLIVEDWKIGWRLKGERNWVDLVTKDEIARLVKIFMDLEICEVKEMRRRAKELRKLSRQAISEGGSSESSISAFIQDISDSLSL